MGKFLKWLAAMLLFLGLTLPSSASAFELDEEEYRVVFEKADDNQSNILLKDKNDEDIHDVLVYSVFPEDLVADDGKRDFFWFVPEFVNEEENSLGYDFDTNEVIALDLSQEVDLIGQETEETEDFHTITHRYGRDNLEFEVVHTVILTENGFNSLRGNDLDRVDPNLVLKYLNESRPKESSNESKEGKSESESEASEESADESDEEDPEPEESSQEDSSEETSEDSSESESEASDESGDETPTESPEPEEPGQEDSSEETSEDSSESEASDESSDETPAEGPETDQPGQEDSSEETSEDSSEAESEDSDEPSDESSVEEIKPDDDETETQPETTIYSGYLYDADGQIITQGNLSLKSDTGESIELETDENGYFIVRLAKDSNYQFSANNIQGELVTKDLNHIELNSDSLSLQTGKRVTNQHGMMNFKPSVAYLDDQFNDYKVFANHVLVNTSEFDYAVGDTIVLPPNAGHIAGQIITIEGVDLIDGQAKINYSTPKFSDVFSKVQIDTKDEGLTLEDFRFQQNENYVFSDLAQSRTVREESEYVDLTVALSQKMSKDGKGKYTANFDNTLILNGQEAQLELELGGKMENNIFIPTASMIKLNGTEMGIDLDDDGGETLTLGDMKFKIEAEKEDDIEVERELSVENGRTFSIGGNIGLVLEYDDLFPWDMKIDFRNNLNTREMTNLTVSGDLDIEIELPALQSPYLVGIDLALKLNAKGEIEFSTDIMSESSNNFVYNDGFVTTNSHSNTSGSSELSGEMQLGGGLELTPFIGIDGIKVTALPTEFGIETYGKASATLENSNMTNEAYGKIYGVVKVNNKYSIELLSDYTFENKIPMNDGDYLLYNQSVIWEGKSESQFVQDENGKKLLELGYKLAPSKTEIVPGVVEDLQATNPGVKVYEKEDGVYLGIDLEEATQRQSEHKLIYYNIPGGILGFFTGKTIDFHTVNVEQDDYYKDITIKKNLSGVNVDEDDDGYVYLYDDISEALEKSGALNQLNRPNSMDNTSIQLFNIPNSLKSINPNELFNPKAELDVFDEGVHEIYVLRKELAMQEDADEKLQKLDNINAVDQWDLNFNSFLKKDSLSDTRYYVDKFLLVIGDEVVKRESQDNLDNVTTVEVAEAEIVEESDVAAPVSEILVDDQLAEIEEPAAEEVVLVEE